MHLPPTCLNMKHIFAKYWAHFIAETHIWLTEKIVAHSKYFWSKLILSRKHTFLFPCLFWEEISKQRGGCSTAFSGVTCMIIHLNLLWFWKITKCVHCLRYGDLPQGPGCFTASNGQKICRMGVGREGQIGEGGISRQSGGWSAAFFRCYLCDHTFESVVVVIFKKLYKFVYILHKIWWHASRSKLEGEGRDK